MAKKPEDIDFDNLTAEQKKIVEATKKRYIKSYAKPVIEIDPKAPKNKVGNRNGHGKFVLTKEIVQKVEELAAKLFTIDKISDYLGISHDTFRNLRNEYKDETKNDYNPDLDLDRIYKKGKAKGQELLVDELYKKIKGKTEGCTTANIFALKAAKWITEEDENIDNIPTAIKIQVIEGKARNFSDD